MAHIKHRGTYADTELLVEPLGTVCSCIAANHIKDAWDFKQPQPQ